MNYQEIIVSRKQEFGSRLAILGHHYQSDSIINYVDHVGDSLELARTIGQLDAEHIVFCGVWFMAESAAILKREGQKIHTPEPNATCTMAEMAQAMTVRKVLKILRGTGRNIIPLTYVNSTAGVKAVVGEMGGAVCTSANARTMLSWAMDQGDGVLFLPDKHLAYNTGSAIGIPVAKRILVDIVNPTDDDDATLFMWPGYCPVHDMYIDADVARARRDDPDALIVVHPECPASVVEAVDANGSTAFIIDYVAEAPDGTTIYVGTESNLVNRLAKEYAGRKTIKHLDAGYCEDMAKVTVEKLGDLLSRLETAVPVETEQSIVIPARLALQRMLDACA
ncbi:MAG: quinolinate synthase NadA [Proteobacteria bacterium]|nr:quinolinate synthase NadA [Pseudomonadota bacterium]